MENIASHSQLICVYVSVSLCLCVCVCVLSVCHIEFHFLNCVFINLNRASGRYTTALFCLCRSRYVRAIVSPI